MSGQLFTQVRQSAHRVGFSVPDWLEKGEVPRFQTVEGERPTPQLILLHGLLGALSNWNSVFPHFAAHCRPVALHFPILKSRPSEAKVSSLALFTEFFLRQRSVGPIPVCGNSLGGHVAMRLCLTSPELVDCLILTGTSGLYEHTVDVLPVRPDRKYIREHMGRVFCQERFVTEEAIEEIYSILSQKANVLNLIHAARSAKKDNLLKLLPNIKVPTLLLWGEDDKITTMEVAELFHKHIPNSTLVTVGNCGHAPMIEHPEWFAEETFKFLRQHSRHFREGAAQSPDGSSSDGAEARTDSSPVAIRR